ncbi:MAG: hypothetical protein K6C94_07900 [Candidatus Gastranaerophilales bacterium]|nr:hypothetical protein [Candidatus Gastranaerophilales bacterium]
MKKQLTTLLISVLLTGIAGAEVTYDELSNPKSPSYRLGTSTDPELEYKIKNVDSFDEQKTKYIKEQLKNKSYADSTLADLSKEIGQLVDTEKEALISDIGILWAGAAAKSETVKFTIYKLSNPDADKPDQSIIKKVVRPLAGLSSMAGAGFLNPIAATTAIMSGALVNSLATDDKELNYKYTKVTDADMIMLLKRVDDLQKRLINEYIDYMSALKASEKAKKMVQNRYEILQKAKTNNREYMLIADAYYRSALEKKQSIELDFLAKRAALEQIVGLDAMAEFEEALKQRHEI